VVLTAVAVVSGAMLARLMRTIFAASAEAEALPGRPRESGGPDVGVEPRRRGDDVSVPGD
jgi:hypothetical protein